MMHDFKHFILYPLLLFFKIIINLLAHVLSLALEKLTAHDSVSKIYCLLLKENVVLIIVKTRKRVLYAL